MDLDWFLPTDVILELVHLFITSIVVHQLEFKYIRIVFPDEGFVLSFRFSSELTTVKTVHLAEFDFDFDFDL
jgi:hypothetical protein